MLPKVKLPLLDLRLNALLRTTDRATCANELITEFRCLDKIGLIKVPRYCDEKGAIYESIVKDWQKFKSLEQRCRSLDENDIP